MAGEKVIIEQDVHTPEPIERSTLYRDSLESSGFKWFAGIGFWAGNALWVLALRRTLDERQFDTCEAHVLSELSAQMTEAAIQSASLGQTALESKMRALDYVDQAALVLDRFGFVISANEATEAIFDSALCIRNGRLFTNDPAANSFLEAFLAQPRTDSDAAMPLDPALTVLSRTSGPLLIRILPVRGIARSPFLAAHSLVLLRDPYSNPGLEPKILSQVFGLSSAEARLAAVMASGVSLEQAAHQLGLALETVRNQLKAIFSKTETHRQAELVALLLRL